MPLPLWEKILLVWAIMHIIGPLALRFTFRYSARVEPAKVDPGALPVAVRAMINRWSSQIQSAGFSLVGIYDMGELASDTRSFLAYFVNRSAGDFADISVVTKDTKTQGYFEFSSSFTNGLTLDTNANKTISVTSTPSDILIFRFPQITSPSQLYQVHRALIQKHAGFLHPQLPPVGEESSRIVKQVGRFGPCQAEAGYMRLASDGTHYRLTWKGACLVAWKSLWPTSLIRRSLYRARMQKVLNSLQSSGIVAISTASNF
ncbi:MAG TPA: hypothetical protein VJW94_16475 [Candidatus Acidoferrum sp.]|nr:hypothetical protein [Candidatus Acidoferrum sp.]